MPALIKLLAALLALAACAQSSPAPTTTPATPPDATAAAAPAPGSPPPCTSGQQWFTPAGSDGDALPGEGCYTPCAAAACPSGQVCRAVTTNPCGKTEDGQVKSCMQAGAQSSVCLPG
jgi:hypothetical protein